MTISVIRILNGVIQQSVYPLCPQPEIMQFPQIKNSSRIASLQSKLLKVYSLLLVWLCFRNTLWDSKLKVCMVQQGQCSLKELQLQYLTSSPGPGPVPQHIQTVQIYGQLLKLSVTTSWLAFQILCQSQFLPKKKHCTKFWAHFFMFLYYVVL